MRICLVTETYPPEINGVALTVRDLGDGLQQLGHQVSVVRPRQEHDSGDTASNHILMPGARLPRYRDLRVGLPVAGRLRRLWQAERPDAVYVATEGPLGWSAVRAARRLGISIASGFHTRFDDFVGHYGLAFLSRMVFSYLRRFHNQTDATLVPTRELAEFLHSSGIGNARLLRRGVDTQRFCPQRRDASLRAEWGLDESALAVLHVGRLAPEKNLGLVLRAFEAIQQVRPEARLIWVGDGPSLPGLRAAHPEHRFCGMRRGDDLARHYASGDLFLFPSLTETFGNVTLESLASGVPVVAFAYGAAGEYLSDANGAPVPRGDEAAFIAAARALACDPAQLRQQALAARQSVAELSPESVARDLASLLAELSQSRRAA